MPGSTFAYSFKTHTWVEGLHQDTEQEIDKNLVAFTLDALYDAWPWDGFWINLSRTAYWSDLRANELPYFKANPKTAGLYTGINNGTEPNRIDLKGSQLLGDPAGVIAHEVGHMMQDIYRLGYDQDSIGRKLWGLQCEIAGTDSLEEFASNVGRILLRRLGRPRETVPKGFENFLEYTRQVRS